MLAGVSGESSRGIRISDTDRERAAGRLQQALAEGRITLDELEERLTTVYAARYAADLRPPFADLPGDDIVAVPPPAAPPERPLVLRSGAGSLRRSGTWTVPSRIRVQTVLGSVLLDFAGTTLPPRVDVTLELGAGSARLLLPDGATADVDGMVSANRQHPQPGGLDPGAGPHPLPGARAQRHGLGDRAPPLPVRRLPVLTLPSTPPVRGGYPAPVTAISPVPAARTGVGAQLARFIAVGALSALVDFGVYQLLLHLGLWVHAAKAISFILGTTTAYVLNRRFTFTSSAGGRGRFAGFVALYATTFALNVGVNALALAVLPAMPLRYTVAWVIAQGTATAVNFVMLRTVVFRH
jgi:putative flippase GtrA